MAELAEIEKGSIVREGSSRHPRDVTELGCLQGALRCRSVTVPPA